MFHYKQTSLIIWWRKNQLYGGNSWNQITNKINQITRKICKEFSFFSLSCMVFNGQTKCWLVIWNNVVFTSIYHNFLGRSPLVIRKCSLLDQAVHSLTKMQYIHFSCEASFRHPPEHRQSSTADAKSHMKNSKLAR